VSAARAKITNESLPRAAGGKAEKLSQRLHPTMGGLFEHDPEQARRALDAGSVRFSEKIMRND